MEQCVLTEDLLPDHCFARRISKPISESFKLCSKALVAQPFSAALAITQVSLDLVAAKSISEESLFMIQTTPQPSRSFESLAEDLLFFNVWTQEALKTIFSSWTHSSSSPSTFES